MQRAFIVLWLVHRCRNTDALSSIGGVIKKVMIWDFGILAASSAGAQSVPYSQPYDGVRYYPGFI
jgi:hypothetical protein